MGAVTVAGRGTRTWRCRSCPTEIIFAVFDTALARAKSTGRPAAKSPVEAGGHPDGDLVLARWAGRNAVVRRLPQAELAEAADEPRYREHMPHCPGRERWARPRPGGGRPGAPAAAPRASRPAAGERHPPP